MAVNSALLRALTRNDHPADTVLEGHSHSHPNLIGGGGLFGGKSRPFEGATAKTMPPFRQGSGGPIPRPYWGDRFGGKSRNIEGVTAKTALRRGPFRR